MSGTGDESTEKGGGRKKVPKRRTGIESGRQGTEIRRSRGKGEDGRGERGGGNGVRQGECGDEAEGVRGGRKVIGKERQGREEGWRKR